MIRIATLTAVAAAHTPMLTALMLSEGSTLAKN